MIDPQEFQRLASEMHEQAQRASTAKLAAIEAEKARVQAREDSDAATKAFHDYVGECAGMDEIPNIHAY